MFPGHIPGRREPVYKVHRAVMLNLQAFRHLSNIRTHPGRHPLNGQKHLMLSRFQTQHASRSEEHTSELQSLTNLVCRLLLEKKKTQEVSQRTSGSASR